jgi:hypothetical protein
MASVAAEVSLKAPDRGGQALGLGCVKTLRPKY